MLDTRAKTNPTRGRVIRFLSLAAILLLVGGLAWNLWSLKRNLDIGYHYRFSGTVPITSHVTKVDLSPDLEREGLKVAHYGDDFEWEDFLFVSKQRRLVLLAIEAKTPAADLLYTLYDANNAPVTGGRLYAVTHADDVVSTNNIMLDDDQKRFVVYGPSGSSGWRATHAIIDDNIAAAKRAVIHR